ANARPPSRTSTSAPTTTRCPSALTTWRRAPVLYQSPLPVSGLDRVLPGRGAQGCVMAGWVAGCCAGERGCGGRFWCGGGGGVAGVDFFVSHAGRDRAWAEWVAWQLREAGYTVEVDAWDWRAGENFVTRMHAAVDAARWVVALLSSAYFEEGRYTADEWSSAL